MVTVTAFAQTVVNQHDQQVTRNDWKNPENAQNRTMDTWATGKYTKKKSKYYKPHTLYAYEFGLSIPEGAAITGYQFIISMKCDKGMKVKAPAVRFNGYKKGAFTHDYTGGKRNKTGDYDGIYHIYPDKYLSENFHKYTYEMPKENIDKFVDINYTIAQHGFGLQLWARDANVTGNIYVKYIKCIVTYEIPHRYITYKNISRSIDAPTEIKIGEPFTIQLETGNTSFVDESKQKIQIDLPIGFEIVDYKMTGAKSKFNIDNQAWTVDGRGGKKNTLDLTIVPQASGAKTIRVYDNGMKWYQAYLFVNSEFDDGDIDTIRIVPHNMRHGELSCIDVYARIQATQSPTALIVHVPETNLTAADVASISLNEEQCIGDVSYSDNYTINNTNILINANVPVNEMAIVSFRICYYPKVHGEGLEFGLTTFPPLNGLDPYSTNIDIAEPYEKKVLFNVNDDGECTETIEILSHRIISQVEADLDIIPIGVDEFDGNMYVDDSTFGINQWKKVRYIGPVEVPYAHYDPEHTTKDKLLDEHYKNKQYLGKENAYDEDIDLKIRVPRKKTPTLIGLVKIDKPIPINLVPYAFENDPLNHRGWAEIYGVKAKPTNPLYDDLSIDVKYITHNIISRFNIDRMGVLNKFKLPDIMKESLNSGGDIGEFFNVDTDGSFVYDEDDVEHHRNLFTFTNQQDIKLRSKNTLAMKTNLEFYWDSVIFNELRENNITKIIRLVDDTDRIVFEYEYFDFDFSDEIYSCSVIGRVLTEQGLNPLINKQIYLHSDVEFTVDTTDEDYDEADMELYGSAVSFELDSNILKIHEHGFSDFEFEETVTLLKGNYYLEVYWKNNNNDADTKHSLQYFSFDIDEIYFDSKLADYYQKLVVSPYPVPYKDIVFTREGEEGTIYFLNDDGGEFNFLLEPFYQYKCGVDLTADGVSIFDFNNSYPVIYIQNGLIRFGINRLNGDLYLDKWDNSARDYIRTNRFRIDKYDDAEATTLSDDVIVVNVSDMVITMWRGRPYVMIEHPKEDIQILGHFKRAFAEGIGAESIGTVTSDYPTNFDLINSTNLLPDCVGGTSVLKSSCITVEEDDTYLEDIGEFVLVPDKTGVFVGEDVQCTLIGTFELNSVSLVINDVVVAQNSTDTNHIEGLITDEGLNTIYCVYHGDDNTRMELSNIVAIQASQYHFETEYKLEYVGKTRTFKYNQGTVDFQLTRNGEPCSGYEVLVSNPHQTWHWTSDSNGMIKTPNNDVVAGTHYWIASVYEDGELLTAKCKVKIKIVEAPSKLEAVDINIKKGDMAIFRLTTDDGVAILDDAVSLKVGGKKYTRYTDPGGLFHIKMSGGDSKKNTKSTKYPCTIKYPGDKGKYKGVKKTFNIIVGA